MRDEVTEEWKKKLHNEELNNLYCLPNIISMIKARRMERIKHVVCTGHMSPVEKIDLEGVGVYADNIKADPKEVALEGVDWMHIDHGKFRNATFQETSIYIHTPQLCRTVMPTTVILSRSSNISIWRLCETNNS
jgi:hypothetical protein